MRAEAPARDVMILDFHGHSPPRLPRPSGVGLGSRPMGSPGQVRSDIDGALADVDWSNPLLGILTDGEVNLALDLGPHDPVDGFVIHLRGGVGAAPLVAHLCLVNGWAALDVQSGVYLDLEEPERWFSGDRAAREA